MWRAVALLVIVVLVVVSMMAVTNLDVRKALGVDRLLGNGEAQPTTAATISLNLVKGEANEK